MGKAMAIAQEEIRSNAKPPEGSQSGVHLAERQQPGNVRKANLCLDRGRLEEVESGKGQAAAFCIPSPQGATSMPAA
jgi:hypothetical protein